MRIIKKLDLFILRNFLMLFAGTFCISLFAVMMQFIWKYVDELVGKGLGIDVIAKFFFYAAETLVPLALPLAILLASLISFGNLGERLELLAIKASGVSLFRTLRPLIIFVAILSGASLYFQDVVAPEAQMNLMQLRYSMLQKSPELDIPEGVFYDGIDGINIYVKQKNKNTGILYDVIIYNMRDGVDNVHILLSDSAKLQTSANKQYLLLHLYSGEQFENLPSGMLKTRYSPYRRETFVEKHFLIDFDTNLNMTDQDAFANSAKTKNMAKLLAAIDSMNVSVDSLSHAYFGQMVNGVLYVYNPADDLHDSTKIKEMKEQLAKGKMPDVDTLFAKMNVSDRQNVIRGALTRVQQQQIDINFKTDLVESQNKEIRKHWLQFWQKITMSLTCLLFFFIGAPLGAIIRKGGLGLPVVVAVVIFIAYYIINTGATNMALEDTIPAWLGMWASMIILTPLGIFLTVKSNNDSVVFNIDSYRAFFRKLLGIRMKRYLTKKDVIINDPDYPVLAQRLMALEQECKKYRKKTKHKLPLLLAINIIKNRRDEKLEWISRELELCVEELSNTKDREIFYYLNRFPIVNTESRFHNRLRKDLKVVSDSCVHIIELINNK